MITLADHIFEFNQSLDFTGKLPAGIIIRKFIMIYQL